MNFVAGELWSRLVEKVYFFTCSRRYRNETEKHLLHIINFSKIHDDDVSGTLEKQTVIDMMMKHQVQGGTIAPLKF